jgi:hypothetical protein
MGRRAEDPSWPLARLASGISGTDLAAMADDNGMVWVLDGPPLDCWVLTPFQSVFGDQYVLAADVIPDVLRLNSPGGGLAQATSARLLARSHPPRSSRGRVRALASVPDSANEGAIF